jgi:hypothetical protein
MSSRKIILSAAATLAMLSGANACDGEGAPRGSIWGNIEHISMLRRLT